VANVDKLADKIAILADGATVTAMITGDQTMAETAAFAAISLLRTAERRMVSYDLIASAASDSRA
jgi:hypothetical protein